MLEIVDVRKSFGATPVLSGVSFTVPAGQTFVLLGPSGCGKTTLLRVMNGLVRPDSGSVRVKGVAVTPENVLALRQRMGYVVQDGGLFPHLTAEGNVTLMARHLGWERDRIHDRLIVLETLVRFRSGMINRYPAELSGGQRQRVGLMRALMLDPDVLLFDEPLGALDPITRAELQADLRAIFRELKKTVVLVTHDLAEAAYFGDEIVLMEAGRIAQRGRMRDLVEMPANAFVEKFVQAQRAPLEALREATA